MNRRRGPPRTPFVLSSGVDHLHSEPSQSADVEPLEGRHLCRLHGALAMTGILRCIFLWQGTFKLQAASGNLTKSKNCREHDNRNSLRHSIAFYRGFSLFYLLKLWVSHCHVWFSEGKPTSNPYPSARDEAYGLWDCSSCRARSECSDDYENTKNQWINTSP